jgi:hypothetical protein
MILGYVALVRAQPNCVRDNGVLDAGEPAVITIMAVDRLRQRPVAGPGR